MNNPTGRRNLLQNLPAQPTIPNSAPSDEDIRAVSEKHGFDAPGSAPLTLHRKRTGAGRTHQLNVRLRPETAARIYAEANARDVPIAQVIEEAIDARFG